MSISRTASDLDSSFVLVGESGQSQVLPRLQPEQPSASSSPTLSSAPGSPVKIPYKPYAHDWSPLSIGGKLSTYGRHFVDGYGRVCQLRGVNLSGSCKTPVNHDHDTFPHDPKAHEVTFVGRPFPLEEAHEHLARLRRWGLTFVRLLVTWEAVEHAAPGSYDESYLDYLHSLLSLFPIYGLSAFVALHQDVWSRYSGGSGAPKWTLESVGFDLDRVHELEEEEDKAIEEEEKVLRGDDNDNNKNGVGGRMRRLVVEETGAAWLRGVRGGGHTEDERGVWPCGYQKLTAATMATCFWAGDTFAPKLKVKKSPDSSEEVSVQRFLQDAFLDMWEVVAKKLGDLEAVIGFEMMNEPHRGYIDLQSMHSFDYNTDLHLGHVPSALQSFTLASGHPTPIPHYTRSFPVPTRLTSHQILNSTGKKVWKDDGPTKGACLWEMHDVWGWDREKGEGVVLREGYWVRDPMSGRKIDWYTDFYYPFLNRWAERVQNVAGRDKLIFVEPIPNEFCPSTWTPEHQPKNMVYAPHWYDLNALFAKAFGDLSVNVQGLSRGMFPPLAFYWGQKGARNNFSLQIRNLTEAGYRSLGEKPVLIGECGVPMDLNKGRAFKTDDWTWQARMMDAMITGLEGSLIGFTLWNYNPDNSDHEGDNWNGENFSWFSQRRALPSSLLSLEQTSPTLDNGGRILRAVVRPYPAKTAGIPRKWRYEVNTGEFEFEWIVPFSASDRTLTEEEKAKAGGAPTINQPPYDIHPTLTSNTTEIYIPSFFTQNNARNLVISGLEAGDRYFHDESVQTLYISSKDMTPGKVHRIQVALDGTGLKRLFEVNDVWSDFGGHVVAGAGIVLAVLAYVFIFYV